MNVPYDRKEVVGSCCVWVWKEKKTLTEKN